MRNILVISLFLCTNSLANTDLEKEFWDCDYVGTVTMLGFSEATNCSAVFEKLKKEKFENSWTLFHQWWKENKDKEHDIRKKRLL